MAPKLLLANDDLLLHIDPYIDFYLFQAHPKFSDEKREALEEFIISINLGKRFAFEPRHPSWFSNENYKWAKN